MQIENIIGQLPKNGSYNTREVIDTAVIHHSATAKTTTPWAIAHYHTYIRGYRGIAYHYLVYYNGRVYQVNEDETLSWHAGDGTYDPRNENNKGLGICLVGNFMERQPPDEQLDATRELLEHLKQKYGKLRIIGHREGWYRGKYGNPTACPGDTWPQWKPVILPRNEFDSLREEAWKAFRHWPKSVRQEARQRGLGGPIAHTTTIQGTTIYPFALGLVIASNGKVKRVLDW